MTEFRAKAARKVKENITNGETKTMKHGYVKKLRHLLEAEVEQAESIIAAKGFSQELQDMIEKLGRLVNEDLPAVSEQMRDAYGADVATGFEDAVSGTLGSVMDSLKSAKQEIDNSVTSIAEGGVPSTASDMETHEVNMDSDELDLGDDDLDLDFDLEGGDELDMEEPLGRAKKESVQNLKKKIVEMKRKLATANAKGAAVHAKKKVANEERVDELSPKVKKNYIAKAGEELRNVSRKRTKAEYGSPEWQLYAQKGKNRKSGLDRAAKVLAPVKPESV